MNDMPRDPADHVDDLSELTSEHLSDFRGLVADLRDGLIEQSERDDAKDSELKARHQEEKEKDRTADSFAEWRERFTEQVAVAWVLTTIFVRYLEDNGLVDKIRIAGDGDAAYEVEDHWRQYLSEHRRDDGTPPTETDYLLHIFRELAESPAGDLFRPDRNFLYEMPIDGDSGQKLLEFFRQTDAESGRLVYRFRTPRGDTRFLGDLYQDLSESAKKRYALLQTPEFVEEFILDHTLEPAIETFGIDDFRFIDPTCGSGHFLIGGFHRVLRHLTDKYPGMDRARRVRKALLATHGVDINPFAVAIARFRLLIAALYTAIPDPDDRSFERAPNLPLRVATGDSLLHGRQFPRWERDVETLGDQTDLFRYRLEAAGETTEDYDLIFGENYRASSTQNDPPHDDRSGEVSRRDGGVRREPEESDGILMQQYHAVVGNPPYITVKDKAHNRAYRRHYESCYYKYSLVCPFYERFFDLAGGKQLGEEQFELGGAPEDAWPHREPGFVGMIVGNAFMKRTFGQKLIEEIIPKTDLTHVIDTSGAYIPGHGTPTIILMGRDRDPQATQVRAALGIRGEPSVPDNAAEAKVWSSIRDHIDEEGFENDFITISDVDRDVFHEHPWSLRGGGVLEAKGQIENGSAQLVDVIDGGIGRAARTGADPIFFHAFADVYRRNFSPVYFWPLVVGEAIRRWSWTGEGVIWFPYEGEQLSVKSLTDNEFAENVDKFWKQRVQLRERATFDGNMQDAGLEWYEYMQYTPSANLTPLSITFAEVATHNHFVLDRGGKVFKQTAPVIKLPEDATEEDHLELLGPLNSSTGEFWMDQMFYEKGGSEEPFQERYQRDGTKMKLFPLPEERPVELPRRLDALGQRMAELQPREIAESGVPTVDRLDDARREREEVLGEMIALQEELDWRFYEIYGLVGEVPKVEDFYEPTGDSDAPSDSSHSSEPPPPIGEDVYDALPQVRLGERPFEIALARKMEAGDIKTSWFDRHGSTPSTEIPDRWPEWYRDLVEARLQMMGSPPAESSADNRGRRGRDDFEQIRTRQTEAMPEASSSTDEIEDAEISRYSASRFVKLIEAPEFKRRWNIDSWEDLEEEALENWLKSRLETSRYFPQAPEATTLTQSDGTRPDVDERPQLTTVAALAHRAREDDDFMEVARRYTGDKIIDTERLIEGFVDEESVPYLPSQRYKKSGIDRRKEWERVWDLQRIEDGEPTAAELFDYTPNHLSDIPDIARTSSPQGEVELDIDKPPKYRKSDYAHGDIYYLRGRLDVPKERFTRYPGLEGDDGSPLISWAGFDHRQRAMALASFYYEAANRRGWGNDRLVPILAGLLDLLPWIAQWHPEPEPRTGQPFAQVIKNMIEGQAQKLGVSIEEIEEARVGS